MAENTDLMRLWHDTPRRRDDVVTIPTIWLMVVLSLLVHLAALWQFLPKLQNSLSPGEADEVAKIGERLAVRLAPPQTQLPAPQASPPEAAAPGPQRQASPPPRPRTPKATPTPAPATPSVIATAPSTLERPALPAPPPAPATAAAAPPRQSAQPIEGDLSSFIAARRRERGDPDPNVTTSRSANGVPSESESERRDRIIAANLGSLTTPSFGTEPKNSGGIFQIRRLGYDDAELTFYGWSKDIHRRTTQKIEVRKGENSDIRMAVVRRIIEVIRDYEQEDFSWSSQRLGRVITLSARQADNAGLEEFMMQEFFSTPRP